MSEGLTFRDREEPAMKTLILNLGALSVTGGIERYCLDLHRCLQSETDRTVTLSLWDPDRPPPSDAADLSAGTYVGCGRSKPKFMHRLARLLRRLRPDVVWLGHELFLPVTPLIRWLCPDARIVALTYGDEVWEPLPRLRRHYLRRVDRVATITRFTAARLTTAQGVSPERIVMLPPALDAALDGARTQHVVHGHDDGSVRHVLSVARLGDDAEEKGLPTAIRALARVVDRHPEVRLTIAGDGTARARLQVLGDALGLGDRLELTGWVSDTELWQCYARSEVFLLPSRKEGFGIVFIEAMAHGLPVVGGNLDATPEVVLDGRTGLIVDPRSEIAVADAVSRLLDDPCLARCLGEAGRFRAFGHFTTRRFAERVRDLLTSLREPLLPPTRRARADVQAGEEREACVS